MCSYEWDEIVFHSRPSTVQRLKFGMHKQVHPTLHWTWEYWFMLGWKLNNVSKRGPRKDALSLPTWHISYLSSLIIWLILVDSALLSNYESPCRDKWARGPSMSLNLIVPCTWWLLTPCIQCLIGIPGISYHSLLYGYSHYIISCTQYRILYWLHLLATIFLVGISYITKCVKNVFLMISFISLIIFPCTQRSLVFSCKFISIILFV